jgi:hypothetical protein
VVGQRPLVSPRTAEPVLRYQATHCQCHGALDAWTARARSSGARAAPSSGSTSSTRASESCRRLRRDGIDDFGKSEELTRQLPVARLLEGDPPRRCASPAPVASCPRTARAGGRPMRSPEPCRRPSYSARWGLPLRFEQHPGLGLRSSTSAGPLRWRPRSWPATTPTIATRCHSTRDLSGFGPIYVQVDEPVTEPCRDERNLPLRSFGRPGREASMCRRTRRPSRV